MKNFSLILLVALLAFTGCNTNAQSDKSTATAKSPSLEMDTNVKIPEGRIDLDIAEFKTKMQDKNIVILDVRTPEETAQGMIEGAIEIDVKNSNFNEKIQTLDKSKTYLVYCRSGRRSVVACDIMEKEGFKNLNNLLGGYNDWPK